MELSTAANEVIQIPYHPPLAELAPEPEAFYFQWKFMYFAFRFEDPALFPPLTLLDSGDIAALKRYSSAARRLASTTLLSAKEEVTIRVKNTPSGQDESVITRFSPHDVTAGFSVMFRQFFSDSEPASFSTVRNIIGRRNRETVDADHDVRAAILKEWRSANAKLLNAPLKTIALRRHYDEMGATDQPVQGEGGRSPRETIQIFNYGDLIHWGDDRATYEALGVTKASAALSRMQFLDAIVGLSHLYLGFSVIVDRVLTACQPE
ncbi:hypothetical protein GCM10010399_64330 [Dactylosporangium fulvum]|uniref:Uncharacterized protein n=1 Tax=Dactylosporangium fulvum TaxID=53359 RepID=A0ABY5W6V9_9ACTN|nr:hypothetical protein [Dactylosporangium fulvum]UWP85743.1 hypothetical protein Dfulv_16475 [Dactylosporangium fulvum]